MSEPSVLQNHTLLVLGPTILFLMGVSVGTNVISYLGGPSENFSRCDMDVSFAGIIAFLLGSSCLIIISHFAPSPLSPAAKLLTDPVVNAKMSKLEALGQKWQLSYEALDLEHVELRREHANLVDERDQMAVQAKRDVNAAQDHLQTCQRSFEAGLEHEKYQKDQLRNLITKLEQDLIQERQATKDMALNSQHGCQLCDQTKALLGTYRDENERLVATNSAFRLDREMVEKSHQTFDALETANKEISRLQATITSKDQDIATANEKVTISESNVNMMILRVGASSPEKFSNRILEIEKEWIEKEAKIDRLTQEKTKLEEDKTALEADKIKLETDKNELETDKTKLEEETKTSQQNMSEVEQLKEMVAKLEDQKSFLLKKAIETNKLKKCWVKLQKEKAAWEQKTSETDSSLAERKDQKDELSRLNEEIAKLHQEKKALEDKTSETHRLLVEQKNWKDELAKLKEAKAKLEEANLRMMEDQISVANHSIMEENTWKNELARLKDENKRMMDEKISNADRSILEENARKEEVWHLKGDVAKLEDERKTLEKRENGLKERLRIALDGNKSLKNSLRKAMFGNESD